MAILTGGILGPVRKKVGNVVGSTWKGINVVRQMPAHVHNPNSEGQQVVRNKFRYASKLASGTLDQIVKPFWDKRAVKMSGYNLLIQKQLEKWSGKEEPDIENVMFSEGCNISARMDGIEVDGNGVGFGVIINSECAMDGVLNKAYIVAVNSPDGSVIAVNSYEYSDNIEISFSCIPVSQIDTVAFYLFVGNPKTGLMSDTVYVETK